MPDFSQAQRERLTEKGQAMASGGFPIRNRADLKRAVQAFGRAKNPEKTKAWILKRAKELDAMDLIPEKWLKNKEVKHMSTEVDDFLAHYGVKGMKWGQRRAHAKSMRSLDKASRSKDKAERADKIDAARDRFRSGQAKADLKNAKAEYKAQKNVIGKREAKKILNEVRERNLKDYETGQQYKNGKEVAAAIAVGVAGTILLSAMSSRS